MFRKNFPAPIATCPAQQGKYTPPDPVQLTCKGWENRPKMLLGNNQAEYFPIALAQKDLPTDWEEKHLKLRAYFSRISGNLLFFGQSLNKENIVNKDELKMLESICRNMQR